MDNFGSIQNKAPFNMALNTLERIGYILSQIRAVGIDTQLPKSKKQSIKVYLVKQFFIQSSPLLKPNVVDKYKEDVMRLKPLSKKVVKRTFSGHLVPTNEEKEEFDENLEIKLDRLLLDIQRELQDEGYFMPPKKNIGTAVGDF